jgi:transposase
MGQINQYSEEYKHEAVRQVENNGNMSQVARALGISPKTLHNWVKGYGSKPSLEGSTTLNEASKRIRQLERALAEKEAQIEVLKKAISIVSQAKKTDLG